MEDNKKKDSVEDLRNVVAFELEAVKSFTELLSAIERADHKEDGEPVWQQSKVHLSVLGEWLYENVQRNIDGVFNFVEDNLGTIELAWDDPSIYGYKEDRLTDIGLRSHINHSELMEKIETREDVQAERESLLNNPSVDEEVKEKLRSFCS